MRCRRAFAASFDFDSNRILACSSRISGFDDSNSKARDHAMSARMKLLSVVSCRARLIHGADSPEFSARGVIW